MNLAFRPFRKAVVKKLQNIMPDQKGSLMENGAEFKIEVSILKDQATVLIDTTGSSPSNVVIGLKKVCPIIGKYGSCNSSAVKLVSR